MDPPLAMPLYVSKATLHSHIFEGSQAHSMSYNGSVSDDPLAVARRVIIADPGLCHHRDLNTLHNVSRPRHTISV